MENLKQSINWLTNSINTITEDIGDHIVKTVKMLRGKL